MAERRIPGAAAPELADRCPIGAVSVRSPGARRSRTLSDVENPGTSHRNACRKALITAPASSTLDTALSECRDGCVDFRKRKLQADPLALTARSDEDVEEH